MKYSSLQKVFGQVRCAHVTLAFAAAACILFDAGVAVGADVQKSVLLLYDSRGDMQGNVVVDQTIRSVLDPKFNVSLDIRSEYFEVSPLSTLDYPLLLSWLRRKYEGIKFDVVVAVGANALRFVREYDRDLFHGAQIVYWGRKNALNGGGSDPPVTGVVAPEMGTQVRGTFHFIESLQPDLKHLIVVSGTSDVDRAYEDAARQELRLFEDRIAITYLAGLSLEDLQKHLVSLPEKTAILFLTMNQDGAGRRLYKSEVLNKVVNEAAAPVYSTSAIHLNTGIIGGALVNQETMAREAADLITRLLHGENIQELSVRESPLTPMINWKGLRRWKISESRLPPGTVVMYKDPSLWTQYRWHVVGAAFLFILEGMLIVALLANRANRRRAVKAMRESQRVLQSTIDALDARIAVLDEQGTIIAVNESWGSFARANGQDGAGDGVGRNYLEVCEKTSVEEARMVSKGMHSLLSGKLADFRCIYSSVRNDETSWFQVRINPFKADGVLRMVVTEEDVTEIKQAHDFQQQLNGMLLRAQDDERRRIARDLHDATVQNLAAIRANLNRIARTPQSMDFVLQETLQESVSLCDRVIQELRTLSYLLHPPLLDEAGLIPALRWFVRGFMERSGIQVELLIMADIGRLGTEVETALFRVVQESLTNIHRHSGSMNAVIWVTKEDGTVRVQITDEGHGFTPRDGSDDQEASLSPGVGIMGMRQRLQQLGGELEIESSPQGTTINATITISRRRDAAYSISR